MKNFILMLLLPLTLLAQSAVDQTFEGTQGLTDEEMTNANNYVHSGLMDRTLQEECAKGTLTKDFGCNDQSAAPGQVLKGQMGQAVEEMIPKLYGMIGMISAMGSKAGGSGGMNQIKMKDKKDGTKQDEKTDVCIYIPTLGEVAMAAWQKTVENKIAERTSILNKSASTFITDFITTNPFLDLTGARPNSIASIVIFLFSFRISHFIYLFFFILALLLIIYYSSYEFSYRVNQFYSTITNFSISPWGRLFHSAYLVFDSNIVFGVGLKNYSIVCDTQIVDPLYYVKDLPQFCSTHPHHFYLEILTESGIVGFFLLFLFFGFFFYSTIKKIKKLRNNVIYKKFKGLLYGSILILLIYFWPIKTSGRFFNNWNGSFFWFNL